MTIEKLINILESIENKNMEILIENIDNPDLPFGIKYIYKTPYYAQIILDNH